MALVELKRRTFALERRADGTRHREEAEAEADRLADWTRCPKMHHDVQQALSLAREILELHSKDGDGQVDAEEEGGEEARECMRSLRDVESRLRRLDLPSFARPAATLSRGKRVHQAATVAGLGKGEEEGEERHGVSGGATRIPSYTTKPSRKVMEHLSVHEDLSEEILQMTQQLKDNANKFKGKLEVQAKQLDQAEEQLEKNVSNVKRRNKQAKAFYKRNWATSCTSYILLFWVAVGFTMMYVFIKFSSIAGYSGAKEL
ncbi:hypothetical protein HOP50_17g79390 [Chloropicon primus]|uniref:Uncharacterized protein n=1 Tax=Chloropicon primus TaxID=1764295 RepID=A0A5B8MXS7_9CHLO|nr:hypothetical protein A3770_17p79170 [Chloropicon primus]UPR04597.1 hypothetical protein HOP50_17g79390 [Chloropicon primus]|eukprot:QDZ25399.1 hypothetical protein A3770_17p79170 [Chloropicon primus]